MKNPLIPGITLIVAALTFWLSWFLMPDQGTADTAHILSIVREARPSVYASVIVQIVSSVLYIPALFLLAANLQAINKFLLAGLILLAIGAMGMCADAFFHLLAYFMTSSQTHLKEGVVQVMEMMQTSGIKFLIPLLLPFFIGTLLLNYGLFKQALSSRIPFFITVLAFATGIIGAPIVNYLGYGRPILILSVLGIFAIAQAYAGCELAVKKSTE
jgi:hypothetical protein